MKLAFFILLLFLIIVAIFINYPTIKSYFRLRQMRKKKELLSFCIEKKRYSYIKRKKGNLYTRILRSKLGRLIHPNIIK